MNQAVRKAHLRLVRGGHLIAARRLFDVKDGEIWIGKTPTDNRVFRALTIEGASYYLSFLGWRVFKAI